MQSCATLGAHLSRHARRMVAHPINLTFRKGVSGQPTAPALVANVEDTYNSLVSMGRLHNDISQVNAACALDDFASRKSNVAAVYLWGSVGSGKSMLMDILVGGQEDGHCTRLHFHELMVRVHKELHDLHMSRPKVVVRTKQGMPIFRFGNIGAAGEGKLTRQTDQGGIANVSPAPLDENKATGMVDAAADDPGSGGADYGRTSEPLSLVTDTIAAWGPLLCLDEMQVTDVADAMLLRQLFEGLFARGVRVVFT